MFYGQEGIKAALTEIEDQYLWDAEACLATETVFDADDMREQITREVMARDEFGWCVAVDPAGGGCTIYHSRPEACRYFRMGGAHCIEARAEYADRNARGIPLRMY